MLSIRLSRIGKRNQPLYQIVVVPKTASVRSKFIEKIGNYDPSKKDLNFDQEKAKKWLKEGAQPTNTVSKLFLKAGLKHKLIVVKQSKAKPKKNKEGATTKTAPIQKENKEATAPEQTTESTEPQKENKKPSSKAVVGRNAV